MDIQGYECMAINGAKHTISNSDNIVLFIEWEYKLLSYQSSKDDIIKCIE